MSKPKTSIIMPVYNTAATVVRAIKSVQAQTDPDWELLVVIDASPDNSFAVIQEYLRLHPDSRIRVFNNQENRKLAGARNYGIERARGAWLAFLDSDDSYKPVFLEKLHTAISRSDAKIDIAVGAHEVVHDTGKRSLRVPAREGIYGGDATALLLLQDRFTPFAWDKLYRADLFSHTRFIDIPAAEDALASLSLLQQANAVVVIADPVYEYAVNPNSLTWKNPASTASSLELMQYMREAAAPLLETRQGKRAYTVSWVLTFLNAAQHALFAQSDEATNILAGARAHITWAQIAAIARMRPLYAAAATLLKMSPAVYRLLYRSYVRKQYGIV